RPPQSTLFPYTTLFRSSAGAAKACVARSRRSLAAAATLVVSPSSAASLIRARSAGQLFWMRASWCWVLPASASDIAIAATHAARSEEHTSELQSRGHLV